MKVQVTSVEFDFESDGEILPEPQQSEVIESVLGNIYDLEDFTGTDEENLDELMEEVTAQTGWCIKSIDYRYILS